MQILDEHQTISDSTEKFYRKVGVVNIMIFIILCLFAVLFLYCIFMEDYSKDIFMFIIFAVIIGSGLLMFIYIFIIDKRPVLKIDEVGFHVIYNQINFVKWEDVEKIFVVKIGSVGMNETMICCNLKDKKLFDKQSFYSKMSMKMNEKSGYGEISIWSSILKESTQNLEVLMNALVTEKDIKERKKIIGSYRAKKFNPK